MNDPTVRAELLARIPAGRFGEPEEIGATVSFLLSGSAPYLAGANITIAGASNV
jgi:NAD(P)-dependent dehydrogenase (short-subunit alcohol dehydrogenase family)